VVQSGQMDEVEEIKKKIDIVSLIGEYITLKKAGRNYKALCPFHSEKTPSFMVSPELQIFKCFGCNEGGDIFAFLQKYEGMEFKEALQFLAKRAGVVLKPTPGVQKSRKEILYKINLLAAQAYHYLLLNHPIGKVALSYLTKERGLRMETIKTFLLGFAPQKRGLLRSFLEKKKGFSPSDLTEAGLVIKTQDGYLERFRGRVIFPLFDHRGNAIGLAGRILPEFEKEGVGKYINSPETPVYHKSAVLYGLNLTRPEIKRSKKAVVVEGELDLISSWQVGVKNIVAIKGTALTEDQVRLLSRYTEDLILALDTDIAGDSAAKRGIIIATNAGLGVRIANLGKYKDPDDFARSDPQSYKEALKKTIEAWDFLIDSVIKRTGINSGSRKAKVAREIIPLLANLDDKILQAHYIGLLARKLKVSEEAVTEQVNKFFSSQPQGTTSLDIFEQPKTKDRIELLEERLMNLVFVFNPFLLSQRKISELITTPFLQKIIKSFKDYKKSKKAKKKFSLSSFFNFLSPELREGFTRVVMTPEDFSDQDKETLAKEIDLVKREIMIIRTKRRLDELADKILLLERARQEDKLEEAKKEFQRLTETFRALKT